jgi:hypothetical protein
MLKAIEAHELGTQYNVFSFKVLSKLKEKIPLPLLYCSSVTVHVT